MLILVTKDSATRISKVVATLDEAKSFADSGFPVHVVGDDGTETPLADVLAAADAQVQALPVEKVTYPDGTEATGVAPLPEESPAGDNAPAAE